MAVSMGLSSSDRKNKIKTRSLWRARITKVDRIVYRFMECPLRLDFTSHQCRQLAGRSNSKIAGLYGG